MTLVPFLSSIFTLSVFGAWAIFAEQGKVNRLIEGVKKEGKMVWQGSMTVDDSDRLLKKFKEKYPFIDTELNRASSISLLNKILMEAKADKYIVGVIVGPGFACRVIKIEVF